MEILAALRSPAAQTGGHATPGGERGRWWDAQKRGERARGCLSGHTDRPQGVQEQSRQSHARTHTLHEDARRSGTLGRTRARGARLSGHTDRPDQLDRQEVHTKRRTRHATRHESARREPTAERTQNGNRSACFGYTFVSGIFEPADISRDAHGPAHAPTGRSLALRADAAPG